MKRKATLLALLGLGSAIVLGLLYWRFSPADSSVVQRSKTDIFAEAFGEGDFERRYSLMTDSFRARVSEPMAQQMWGLPRANFGEFRGTTRLRPPKPLLAPGPETIALEPDMRAEMALHMRAHICREVIYEVRYTNGDLLLLIQTRDGTENSPIQVFNVVNQTIYQWPTPTPSKGPIS